MKTKRMITLILVLAAFLSLAGCGSQQNTPAQIEVRYRTPFKMPVFSLYLYVPAMLDLATTILNIPFQLQAVLLQPIGAPRLICITVIPEGGYRLACSEQLLEKSFHLFHRTSQETIEVTRFIRLLDYIPVRYRTVLEHFNI